MTILLWEHAHLTIGISKVQYLRIWLAICIAYVGHQTLPIFADVGLACETKTSNQGKG